MEKLLKRAMTAVSVVTGKREPWKDAKLVPLIVALIEAASQSGGSVRMDEQQFHDLVSATLRAR